MSKGIIAKITGKTLTFADEDKGKAAISKYTYGIQNQREAMRKLKRIDESDEEDQDMNNPREIRSRKSIVVIRNDENIKKLVCSRSSSYYGYVAIIDESKLTIYLA